MDEQEEMIKMKMKRTSKLNFQKTDMEHFWLCVNNEYALLSKHATRIAILLPFATTHL